MKLEPTLLFLVYRPQWLILIMFAMSGSCAARMSGPPAAAQVRAAGSARCRTAAARSSATPRAELAAQPLRTRSWMPHAPKSLGRNTKWSAPMLLLKKGQACLMWLTTSLSWAEASPTLPAGDSKVKVNSTTKRTPHQINLNMGCKCSLAQPAAA